MTGWFQIRWKYVSTARALNFVGSQLEKDIIAVADKHVTRSSPNNKRKRCWNRDIATAVRSLRRLKGRWNRVRASNPSLAESLKDQIKDSKKQVQRKIYDVKTCAWQRFFQETETKDMWSTLKRVTKSRTPVVLDSIVALDGSRRSNNDEIIETLKKKFFPCEPEEDLSLEENLQSDFSNRFPPITAEEILCGIHSQKEYGGAPGHDEISNVLLRHRSHIYTPLLTGIMNACLRLRTHRPTWKCADVIAFPKSDDHKIRVAKLRFISLIPVIGKVLEKLMCERLTHFLEQNEKISNRQFGFRRHNSCELAVLHLVGKIEEKLRRHIIQVFPSKPYMPNHIS